MRTITDQQPSTQSIELAQPLNLPGTSDFDNTIDFARRNLHKFSSFEDMQEEMERQLILKLRNNQKTATKSTATKSP